MSVIEAIVLAVVQGLSEFLRQEGVQSQGGSTSPINGMSSASAAFTASVIVMLRGRRTRWTRTGCAASAAGSVSLRNDPMDCWNVPR